MPSLDNLFPSASAYTHTYNPIMRLGHNCLWWALGIPEPLSHFSHLANLDYKVGDVATAFLRKVDELHAEGYLHYDSSNFIRVNSTSNVPKTATHVFKVFGFRTCQVWNPGFRCYFDRPGDFHVIRGTLTPNGVMWEHKFGWEEDPREMTEADSDELRSDYGDNYIIFAYTPSR